MCHGMLEDDEALHAGAAEDEETLHAGAVLWLVQMAS